MVINNRDIWRTGRSSVRYGTRLGDLKNKQPTHTSALNWQGPAAPVPRRLSESAEILCQWDGRAAAPGAGVGRHSQRQSKGVGFGARWLAPELYPVT